MGTFLVFMSKGLHGADPGSSGAASREQAHQISSQSASEKRNARDTALMLVPEYGSCGFPIDCRQAVFRRLLRGKAKEKGFERKGEKAGRERHPREKGLPVKGISGTPRKGQKARAARIRRRVLSPM
jgi:hypothetical protein